MEDNFCHRSPFAKVKDGYDIIVMIITGLQ